MRLAITIGIAGITLLSGTLPVIAGCDGTVAKRAGDGATFVADSFGYGRLAEKTRRGTVVHDVDIWRGKVGSDTRYFHVTEIPMKSGASMGSTARASDFRGKVTWQSALGFPLGGEFEITSGPMRGKWSTECDRGPADDLRENAMEEKPAEEKAKEEKPE